MATYNFYKQNVQGFTNVAETVKTLEKIAATDLQVVRTAVDQLNNYSNALTMTFVRMRQHTGSIVPFGEQRTRATKRLVILFVGDASMTGDLWPALFQHHHAVHSNDEHIIVSISEKGRLPTGTPHSNDQFTFKDTVTSVADVVQLFAHVRSAYETGTYSSLELCFQLPISIDKHQPVSQPLLPFSLERFDRTNQTTAHISPGLPIFASAKKHLLTQLLSDILLAQLYAAILETRLAELSARTIALEHAAQKTSKLVDYYTHKASVERRHVSTQRQLGRFASRAIM